MKKTVVHIAEVAIDRSGGMGRVAWHWKNAFQDRGWRFFHIGPSEVGPLPHPAFFPWVAARRYKKAVEAADVLLVHEGAAGAFCEHGRKLVTVSHGVERRLWELHRSNRFPELGPISLKTRMFFPWWRLRVCDYGFQKSRAALLINNEDCAYVKKRYPVKDRAIFMFRNGVDASCENETTAPIGDLRVLFIGTWLPRKGVRTLADAARRLHSASIEANWIFAGTGVEDSHVWRGWPTELHSRTQGMALALAVLG